jgi:hypothetical protein
MRRIAVAWMLAVAVIGSVACQLTEPSGASVPDNPGTVVGQVTDQAGVPMRGVWVYVHDIPNDVGTTYTKGVPTEANGKATISWVTAGPRRVEVKPPAGYRAAVLIVPVEVVKGKSVSAAFVLTRE